MGSSERKNTPGDANSELPPYRLNRRTAVGGFAGGILAAAGMVPVGNAVFAQDAEQVAEDATPVSTEEEGALPRIPPEIAEFAAHWPMAQQNYEATRVATSSTIDSSNV